MYFIYFKIIIDILNGYDSIQNRRKQVLGKKFKSDWDMMNYVFTIPSIIIMVILSNGPCCYDFSVYSYYLLITKMILDRTTSSYC